MAGPRGSHLPPSGAERYVLGGDDTALPAVSRWMRTLGPTTPLTVLLEVTDEDDERYPLPAPGPDQTVRWLHRRGAAAGAPTPLQDAVRALTPPTGAVYWWFAGESTGLKDVRRYLRRELGLPKESVDVDGYWRRGEAEHDHHAPVDPDDPH